MKPILLVEDDDSDIELAEIAFEQARVANPLVIARDGVEALAYLGIGRESDGHAANEEVVVVLLDLNLPRLGGLKVLARIRAAERTKLLPVVVLTSSRQEQDLLIARALDASAYMTKPVDFEKLVIAVRQMALSWTVFRERISDPPRAPHSSAAQ
jgi:two-component system, response regulator